MSKTEEKKIYRVFAQKEGITITAQTHETTMDAVKKIAIVDVLGGVNKAVGFQPYVAVPLTTQERWEAGYINFCPRCGSNISEYNLEKYANTDCFECDASLNISVEVYDRSEED